MIRKCPECVIKIATGIISAPMATNQQFDFCSEMGAFNKSKLCFMVTGTRCVRIPVSAVVKGPKAIPNRTTRLSADLRESGQAKKDEKKKVSCP